VPAPGFSRARQRACLARLSSPSGFVFPLQHARLFAYDDELLIRRTGLTYAVVGAALTLVIAATSGKVVVTAATGAVNVAAAANGGVATASSSWPGYPPSAINNGDRRGAPYGGNGTWSDGTGNVFPDWVQIDFAGAKTIERVDVFAPQDNRSAPVEPTSTLTCGACPQDFTVQYWTGAAWQALPDGVVRNNTVVWRTFTFTPLTTSKIRVLVERSASGWSELAEVEAYTASNSAPTVSLITPLEGAAGVAPAAFTLSAQAADAEGPVSKVQFLANGTLLYEDTVSPFTFDWTSVPAGTYTVTAVAFDGGGLSTISTSVHVTVTAPVSGTSARVNVAAAANGGAATASSAWGGYAPGAAINGDRRGAPYGGNGTWSDGTGNVFPDWVQVDFSGTKTIAEIDVIGLQDNRSAPIDPTPTLTCSGCPLDFTVQYWTGASWQAVPNGVVRNNTLVWRMFTFAPVTTSKIRVLVERSATGWSELAEVEAYTATAGGTVNAAPLVSMATPASGATFVAPASIPLSATANDGDGTIQKVEFYSGTTLLSTVSTPPYAFTWTGVAAGAYSVSAMAYDNLGAKTLASWRDITVTSGALLSKAVFVPAIVPDSVGNYLFEIFTAGADPAVSAPIATQDVGLPAVVNGECTADVKTIILGLTPGSYVATVSAITSQGIKLRSNVFAFTR